VRRAALLLALAACDATPALPDADLTPDALVCGPDEMPATPTIVAPGAGRIDIVADTLVLQSSPFSDPDPNDAQGGSEWEIWSMAGQVPLERIWHAELEGMATEVTIAEGEYEGIAIGRGLEPWTRYVARVRLRDDHGPCSRFSMWSTDLEFKTDDGSTWLFDQNAEVREFYLTIPPESWDPINAEAWPPGCVPWQRTYYTGALTFDGETYDGVGIHTKGGCGSSRDLNGKASFKVNFEWDDPAVPGCPDERRLHGQKHLVFNNGVQDWTAQHERLAYWLYQMLGVPTPRAASVRLYVNGDYWGLYTLVEAIDRRFLERWFASKDGMLYEGTYWCDLLPMNVPPGDEDTYCLTREFKPDACSGAPDPGADPETYELLREFVNRVDAMPIAQFYPQIEEFFDMDTFLSQWALEGVISHWDAYEFSILNNYRVYHDPVTDRWSIIPTGVDQTFLGDQEPWDVYGVLARRCLEEPDCQAQFKARVALVNDLFEATDIAGRAAANYTQIWPHVQEDPRREYDDAGFMQAYQDLLFYVATRPTRVREILLEH
jgi:hypothetical protein